MKLKENWEKFFKEEKNPFKDYPLGIWMGSYCYFCPECGKPVPICTCGIAKKKIEKIKAD